MELTDPRFDRVPVDRLPSVTVVMPVRNEGAFMRRSLGAVLAQDYPPDRLEVIVADGLSDDGTREIVRELLPAHPRLRLLDNPGRIAPTGMNAGIAAATGDVIVRVDGHTIVAPDYVRECVAALARTGAQTVGGRMDAASATPFGQAVALATSSRFGVGGSRFHYSDREEPADSVYLGAWRRDVFSRFGLFDEELVRNQDDEFNYRIQAGGGRVMLCPRIRSVYFGRSTPRSLWRQYFQYGVWKVRVMQKHPSQMRWRHYVPAAFVSTVAAAAALAALWPPAAVTLAVTAALYTGAAVMFAVATVRLARRWDLLPRVVVVFALLHVGYGAGFLVGLGRFAGRWPRRRSAIVGVGKAIGAAGERG